MFLQGDWQVINTSSDFFLLRVYGQRITCEACVQPLKQESLVTPNGLFSCQSDMHESHLGYFTLKMLRQHQVQARRRELELERADPCFVFQDFEK